MTIRWLQPKRHKKCTSPFYRNFYCGERKDDLQLAQEESRAKIVNDFKKMKK
jgi:hypothetical protein